MAYSLSPKKPYKQAEAFFSGHLYNSRDVFFFFFFFVSDWLRKINLLPTITVHKHFPSNHTLLVVLFVCAGCVRSGDSEKSWSGPS